MQVLELMELAPRASALVGVPGGSGLSVEQRKRLTIGVELVANPSIIFMVGTASQTIMTAVHSPHPGRCVFVSAYGAGPLCAAEWESGRSAYRDHSFEHSL